MQLGTHRVRAGFHDNEVALGQIFQFVRREQCTFRHLQTLACTVLALADRTGQNRPAAERFGERFRRLAVGCEAAEDRILTVIGYDLRALLTVILFELRETLDDRHERQLAAAACGKERQNVKGRHRAEFVAVKYHTLF